MLSEAVRDRVYLGFLILHIPITLLVDLQALFFAESIAPAFLRKIYGFAADGDPLLTNANAPGWVWFQTFIFLEAFFQLPVFCFGISGLLKGSRAIWPLLAVYGASSSTTTLACLATVLTMKGYEQEVPKLMASYVPFFLVPFAMAVDYVIRLSNLAATPQTLRVEKEKGQ